MLIYKVATYCQSKLAEQSYHMQLGSVYWDQAQQQVMITHLTSCFLSGPQPPHPHPQSMPLHSIETGCTLEMDFAFPSAGRKRKTSMFHYARFAFLLWCLICKAHLRCKARLSSMHQEHTAAV